MRPRFRILEHTGDLAVQIWGDDPPDLLRSAGEALFHLIAEGLPVRPRLRRRVEAGGADIPELVVAWMNALLLLHQRDGLLLCRFEPVRVGDGRAEGAVSGERVDPGRHAGVREIKAATYHGLQLERDGARLTLRVVLDV